MHNFIQDYIEHNSEEFTQLSDKIWHFAETKFHEHQSAHALKHVLMDHGFTIEENIPNLDTAFIASYGEGSPIIGILGEFDALPGLSQQKITRKEPLEKGGNGHGCGHNLLGVGSLAACCALQSALETNPQSGTIRYYGCPAEEGGSGKVYMIHAGMFDDVDLCLTWHPEDLNMVQVQNWEAVIGLKYQFHGKSAHAAMDPYNGRSALDAVELMNVGANYLREHLLPSAKLHYIITHGGDAPNVVPDFAESYYYIRAPLLKQCHEILIRLNKVASGAAMMTETTYDHRITHGASNYLSNRTIEDVLFQQMQLIGYPKFDQKDKDFAREIKTTLDPDFFENLVSRVPAEYRPLAEAIRPMDLCEAVIPIFGRDVVFPGSTDVGDVSWVVPTAQFNSACFAIGSPGHSWQRVAQAGSSVGHKGMLHAAKILASSAWQLLTDSDLLAEAKAEFSQKRENNPYKPAIPKGSLPPF